MSPRSRLLLLALSLIGLAPWSVTSARPASAALSAADVPTGSDSYREAVKRFFERVEPKIVGGQLAPPGAFPWQVSLGVSWIADPFRAHYCGGAVYRPGWIITAAHCVYRTAARDIVVTAGTHQLGASGLRRNVKRIIVHGSYKKTTSDFDIALLELFDPLPISEAIQPISLVGPEEEAAVLQSAPNLVTLGWGATQEGGTSVRDLRFVRVNAIDRLQCNRPLAYDGRITSNMLCAGVPAGGMDSCQGDSGGPLVVDDTAAPKLIGVVSWGEGCARPNRVGVYTRIPAFAKWIQACSTDQPDCR